MDEIELVKKLVNINSENPPGDEGKIAKFIEHTLSEIGVKSEVIEIDKNRFNVIAEIGQGEGFALSSHMDTVPIGDASVWKHSPLSGKAYGGKIYGRGTTDTKGGLASILAALSKVDIKNPKRRLVLLFVCDEEVDSRGSKWIVKNRKKFLKGVKYGITTEATGNKIRVAQKGLVQVKIRFHGKAAHGSKPWNGDNAVDKAAKFIYELHKNEKQLLHLKDDVLGHGTINIGKISGGVKVNMVPDYCEVDIDRRTVPGETPYTVIRDFRRILKKACVNAEIENLCEPTFAFKLNKNSKVIKMILDAIRTEVVGDTGYTEAEIYKRMAGVDCVAFGPGDPKVAHAVDEYIEIRKLKQATSTFETLIKMWLNGEGI